MYLYSSGYDPYQTFFQQFSQSYSFLFHPKMHMKEAVEEAVYECVAEDVDRGSYESIQSIIRTIMANFMSLFNDEEKQQACLIVSEDSMKTPEEFVEGTRKFLMGPVLSYACRLMMMMMDCANLPKIETWEEWSEVLLGPCAGGTQQSVGGKELCKIVRSLERICLRSVSVFLNCFCFLELFLLYILVFG
jgi:hypothetical protein